MIGVDTNVLVRYIVADDEDQTRRAAAFLEGAISVDDPGFVSVVVLVELVWTLERDYRFSPDEIAGAIESVLRAEPLRIDRRAEVVEALGVFRVGLFEPGDCLVAGQVRPFEPEFAGHTRSPRVAKRIASASADEGRTVRNPTTSTGLPVEGQIHKKWNPRKGGLPTFCRK